MLIAFEGIDGTGKTTISKCLYEKLQKRFTNVYWYPIDTKKTLSLEDAKDPIKSYNYFLDGLKECANKANDNFLIFDRYYLSALGYRILRNNENIKLIDMHKEIQDITTYIPKADITFILDVPHRERVQNIANKAIIDNYDLSSLRKDNIIFWQTFYMQQINQLTYMILHDNNIERTVDQLFNIILDKFSHLCFSVEKKYA